MPFPSGITPKTVTVGIASFTDGSLASGTVTITAPVNLIHTPTNRPIFSSSMTQPFVDGQATFTLIPTDAPGLNRQDWTFKCNVNVSGALVQPDPIWFTLPTAGPDTIDLDGLVTVPSSAGVPISVDVLTVPGGGSTGQALIYNGSGGVTWGTAGGASLTPTATKTAAYTAAVGDLAVMNVAAGATALALPTAPADKAQVGFRAVGATTAVPLVVTRGGTDTIGDTGATSVSLPLSGEVTVYQYQASSTRWLPVSNVKPLAALDARYPLVSALGATVAADPTVRAAFVVTVPPSGDTTGATDTVAINAALAAGGIVRLTAHGAYVVKKATGQAVCLYAGQVAGTILDARGATITEVIGSNCPMFTDLGHAQMLNGGAWVASSGVEVWGGTWDRQSNGGTGNGLHTMILGGDGAKALGCSYKSTQGKYSVLFQNATNFRYRDLVFLSTYSDGCHIQGPASGGRGGDLRGTTGDDMFAITACDYPSYTWGNEGDVTDIHCEGVSNTNAGSRHVIVVAGRAGGTTALNVTDVTITNITGSKAGANTQPAIILGEDLGQATTTGGTLDRITIDGVNVTGVASGQPIIKHVGNASSNKVNDLTIRNVRLRTDCYAILQTASLIGTLTVSGWKGSTSTAAMYQAIYLQDGNAWVTIDRISADDIDLTQAVAGGGFVHATAAGQALTEVSLTRVRLNKFAWVGDVITATTFRCVAVRHQANSAGIFNVRAGGGTLVVAAWDGCTADATSSGINAALESRATGFPLDITNANVVKNNGNRGTLRVAAAGTLTNGQVVEYNTVGAHWYGVNGTLY